MENNCMMMLNMIGYEMLEYLHCCKCYL